MLKLNPLDIKKYPRNDIGMARLFHDMFSDELLFCADEDVWYSWSGSNWEHDSTLRRCECAKIMHETVMNAVLSDAALSGNEGVVKFYEGLSRKQNRDRIISDAESINPIISTKFDRDKFLFNCKNGTYNLKTGEFHEHNREDFITRLSNVAYNPNAECHQFCKYLLEVMQGDKSKIDYLMQIAAYCLTGDTSRECFFILYGDKTRNGKSTFVSTLKYLMGNYAETLKPASITRKNISNGGSGATPDISKLQKSRLVVVSELEENMVLDISLVKTMTGGNELAARHLYKSEFTFVPQFKILIDTNYLPNMTDDSIFNSDRLHILCFDRHFELHERNMQLKEILQTEVDGIFNFILTYLPSLTENGLQVPKQSEDTLFEYSLTSNNVKQFTIDKLFAKTSGYERSTDVYKAYTEWCDESNYKCIGLKRFKKKLMELGYKYTEKTRHTNDRGISDNTIWIQGITLTEPIIRETSLPLKNTDKQETFESYMKEIDEDDLPF